MVVLISFRIWPNRSPLSIRMQTKCAWAVLVVLALSPLACSHQGTRMTVEEALRQAPDLDGKEIDLKGFVVITRHSLGVVDSCAKRRELALVIPPGFDREPAGDKLLQAIYGRHPITFWTASRVVLRGRLYSRGAGAQPEFVLTKILEQVQTGSKCDLPRYAPHRRGRERGQ